MTLRILNWPEDEKELWPWLEYQLTSTSLRSLVLQLEAFQLSKEHASSDCPSLQLTKLLGTGLPVLLHQGLSSLDSSTKQQLFRSLTSEPRLLLALQEIVLRDGGEYWDRVAPIPSHATNVTTATSPVSSQDVPDTAPKQGMIKFERRWFFSLTVLAAALLIGFIVWQIGSNSRNSSSDGKFFARRGLLDRPTTEVEFVSSVAAAVREDWIHFDGPFRDKLVALRDSCDVLLTAKLNQLSDAKQRDLRARCQRWRVALTEYIAALDSQADIEQIQSNANATVEKLTLAIEQLI